MAQNGMAFFIDMLTEVVIRKTTVTFESYYVNNNSLLGETIFSYGNIIYDDVIFVIDVGYLVTVQTVINVVSQSRSGNSSFYGFSLECPVQFQTYVNLQNQDIQCQRHSTHRWQ